MKLGGDQIEWASNEIAAAARHYRGEAIYEKERRPLKAKSRDQIEALVKCLDQFRIRAAALSEEARAALDSFSVELEGKPVTPALNAALKVLASVHSTMHLAADVSADTGRPPKEARRRFIQRLAAIWAAVHKGQWPGRPNPGWDTHSKDREDYPFNLFAHECALPLAGGKGLDDVIREVCHMDPAAAEAILATYVPSKAPGKSRPKKG